MDGNRVSLYGSPSSVTYEHCNLQQIENLQQAQFPNILFLRLNDCDPSRGTQISKVFYIVFHDLTLKRKNKINNERHY